MFYNTHAHIATKLFNSNNNLLIIGSILPDIAITKIFDWDHGLHGKDKGYELIDYIKKEDRSFEFLGKGVLAHSIVDDFAHHDYRGGKGFAYQNNQKLASLCKEYYEVDDLMALKKAHNYIESAVDICLLQDYSNMQNEVSKALKKTDFKKLSVFLGKYLKLDSQKFYQASELYFNMVTKNDLNKRAGWVLFWQDLNKMMSLKAIENAQIETLINEGLSIVKDTYKDFLDYSVSEGKAFIKYQ